MKIPKVAFMLLASGWLAMPMARAVMPEAGEWANDSELTGQPGRGFQIDVQDKAIVVIFMGNAGDGSATWYLSTSTLSGDAFTGPLEQFAGGTAYGSGAVSAHSTGSAGSVTLTFTDATHGHITPPGVALGMKPPQ